MNQNVQLLIDLGHPEILQIGGILMLLAELYVVGGIFCALGAITAILRTGIRIQRAQAEIQAKQEALSQVSEAGGELATAISSLFGASGNKSVVH